MLNFTKYFSIAIVKVFTKYFFMAIVKVFTKYLFMAIVKVFTKYFCNGYCQSGNPIPYKTVI